MFDVKKLLKNRCAVSEVMGEVLLTTIAVLLVSFIAIFISTYDGATDVPHTQVKEWMDEDADTIYLEHSGGEFLETESIEIVVNINGTRYVYPSSEIYTNLGNSSSWQLGDTIAINTNNEWGVDITDDSEIRVFLIDTYTRQTIQYLTVSLEENDSPDWIPPQGEVKDTSTGGLATPYDVYKEDIYHTTYHPPQYSDNYTHEEFNFATPSTLWGIDPGDNITSVHLKIRFMVKDSSCKDIKLRIWEGYSYYTGTWHEEGLIGHNSFESDTIDLSAYIDNTDEVGNLKVQLVAVSNPDSVKSLYVDYIALKVS